MMDYFSLATLGSLILGGFGWLLKTARPTALQDLATLEPWLRLAWNAVESISKTLGWSSPKKFAEFVRRVEQFTGKKLSAAELARATAYAEQRAQEAKLELERVKQLLDFDAQIARLNATFAKHEAAWNKSP